MEMVVLAVRVSRSRRSGATEIVGSFLLSLKNTICVYNNFTVLCKKFALVNGIFFFFTLIIYNPRESNNCFTLEISQKQSVYLIKLLVHPAFYII